MRLALCAASLLLATAFAPAQTTTTSLADLLDNAIDTNEGTERLIVGMQVVDLESGEVLYDRMGEKLFVPASNVKLYSSAVALDYYGPDHQFTTTLRMTAAGRASSGEQIVRMALIGGGDPTFTSDDLRSLIERAAGQLREGVVVSLPIDVLDAPEGEPARFSVPLKGPGWMWDDDPGTYNMSITNPMMDYNVMRVLVDNEGGQLVARLSPASNHPPIVFTDDTRTVRPVRATRDPFVEEVRIAPSGSGDFSRVNSRMSMHDPRPWIAGVAAAMVADVGIPTTTERGNPTANTIDVAHSGKPMAEVLSLFNKPSENAIGEMLLLNLAADHGGGASSWTAGSRVIGDWLTSTVGLPSGSFRLVDGSGLSRYNQVTPEGTIALLRHMWEHSHREVYFESLPVNGVDGTMRNRGGDRVTGRVFAKTGTLSGSSCLSGYVQTLDDRWLAFSILTNGFAGSSVPARSLQDRLTAILVTGEE